MSLSRRARATIERATVIESLESRLLMARAVGVDVSQYQGAINWTTMKSQTDFVMMRASSSDFGTNADANGNAPDTRFAGAGGSGTTYQNASQAKAAGVLYGVYHYAYPQSTTQTATQQADYFWSVAGARMGGGYLPPVVDLETGGTNLGKTAYSVWANAFCQRIYDLSGVKPLIYCNTNYAQTYLDSTVTKWPLWVAAWQGASAGQTGTPGTGVWPAGTWKFWQHYNQGTASTFGASSTYIDLDVYNGDATALQTMIQPLAPEVNVVQAGANVISGQATAISFGTITNGGTAASLSFTIRNDGTQTLNLSGLTVPTGYSVTNSLVATLAPGATDTLTLQLDNSVSGVKSGNISFATNDTTENPFTIKITGTVSPKAPSALAVTGTTSSSVTLGWTDVSDETQFLVERKTGAAGTYAQVGTTAANATSYTDSTGLLPGTTYYYRVRDVATGTIYSAYSSEVSTTTLANVPTGLAATDGTTSTAVHVTWSAATGAASYAVFRNSTNNSGTATQIGTTTSLFYDDSAVAGDTVAYYWVKALNSASQPSGFSTSDSGWRDTVAPTVLASSFNYDVLPQKIIVQFSENVISSLASGDVVVQDQNDLSKPAFSPTGWTFDANTNTATFTFSAQIPDSYYLAKITATDVRDPANNPLPADMNLEFFTLTGDGTHDGKVDISDFNIVATNFGKTGQTYGQGNYDYSADGTVNITDFNLLATKFGTVQARPATPASFAATSTTSTTVASTATVGQPVGSTTSAKQEDSDLLTAAGLL